MPLRNIVACVAIGSASFVTAINIWLNGDGMSIAALFGLIGTVVGYSFGRSNDA